MQVVPNKHERKTRDRKYLQDIVLQKHKRQTWGRKWSERVVPQKYMTDLGKVVQFGGGPSETNFDQKKQ